jgi:allophanate hydrolase
MAACARHAAYAHLPNAADLAERTRRTRFLARFSRNTEPHVVETVAEILQAYRTGKARPQDVVARSYQRIRAHDDPAIFISLRDEAELLAEARALQQAGNTSLPLYGIPVAVKDNIDVKGLPTTAACPAYSYRPNKDAACVARLREAGALIVGKTNLDQFATGLVGVRTPYGIGRNLFDPKLIPGGSSAGSALAVGAGLTPLSLGTDTAGSGRVPAAFANIVGLKPSRGLVSNMGVVPACRTLDCVSVFALTVDDATAALSVIAGPDAGEPSGRPLSDRAGPMPEGLRLGVPLPGQRLFFGDRASEALYEASLAQFAKLGAKIVEIDIEPFYAAARLLYEGPWVAERYLTTRALIASSPESVLPVTRQIILAGAHGTAADAFAAFYQLDDLRGMRDHTFRGIDAMVLPTSPTIYSVAQVEADPIALNSRLGTYTNFVNLLDMSGLAVPAAMRPDGTPFGVTLLGRAHDDIALAAIGRAFHAATKLPLGALNYPQPPLGEGAPPLAPDEVPLAVVGAHLSGMPLNGELRALGARLIEQAVTAPHYRLYALSGTQPPKPGLLRTKKAAGVPIAVEVYALSESAFGRFVAAVPPPLSIGTLELADGRSLKGFLVEAEAVAGARDISSFGGWRAFMAQETAPVV